MATVTQTPFLARFACLGAECEDTCCKGWNMQLDDASYSRYIVSGSEDLLEATAEAEAGRIMKRDPDTDYCVRFEGLCGIQLRHGSDYLGDACHFYPRITRRLGEHTVMTGALSCPEIARLALLQPQDGLAVTLDIDRVPGEMRDYLPEGVAAQEALALHQLFLDACGEEIPAEHILLRLASVARSLDTLPPTAWANAAPTYLRLADGRLPPAERMHEDPFNLLHALAGLAVATRKPISPRLAEIIAAIEYNLQSRIDWKEVRIITGEGSYNAWLTLLDNWNGKKKRFNLFLRRWIAAQLSMALFPYGGFGGTLTERMTVIAVRFATLRLALMAAAQDEAEAVRVAQVLSRFLDHLADPQFSLKIYAETGWIRDARLRGMLEI